MVSERFLPIARAAVQDESFSASWAQGRALKYEAAVAYASENTYTLRTGE
jgi:hypothetical protein